jgi:hypothetical protein
LSVKADEQCADEGYHSPASPGAEDLHADEAHDNDDDESDLNDAEYQGIHDLFTAIQSPEPATIPSTFINDRPATEDNLNTGFQAETHWKSRMQVMRFRQTAEQVATEYLKKLTAGKTGKPQRQRESRAKHFDEAAFDQGQEDGKEIDVRQKAIKKA